MCVIITHCAGKLCMQNFVMYSKTKSVCETEIRHLGDHLLTISLSVSLSNKLGWCKFQGVFKQKNQILYAGFLHIFPSQIQALFKHFQHLKTVANYICIYSTYCRYSIVKCPLIHHIKSDVIVLKNTKSWFS